MLLAIVFCVVPPAAAGHEPSPEIDILEILTVAEMRERESHTDPAWRVTLVKKIHRNGKAYWLVHYSSVSDDDEGMVLDGTINLFIDAHTAEIVKGTR